MGKVIILLSIILSALATMLCYLFIAEKIAFGEGRISEGQKEIDKGQPEIDEGIFRLKIGKIELSDGKKEYERSGENLFLVLFDDLLQSGKGFREAKEKIDEGDRQIAKGQDDIDAGEKRLDAGRLELLLGKEQLKQAKLVCKVFAFGVFFLASLSIVLGVCWRKSLAQICSEPLKIPKLILGGK
ncbi:MAG TPA: hypothetical protein DCZ94_15835 [Lentisphaeria bacterium]|nr:MAG: hypothetical protein A2X48_18600 [Lentisphaerae bacterium GWF2_49_21]HBC88420.1 hypothetical protein [Lentisphaeria bacterium]